MSKKRMFILGIALIVGIVIGLEMQHVEKRTYTQELSEASIIHHHTSWCYRENEIREIVCFAEFYIDESIHVGDDYKSWRYSFMISAADWNIRIVYLRWTDPERSLG